VESSETVGEYLAAAKMGEEAGYIRNKPSNIERWDDPLTGEWRLKIKREGSVRQGLLASSRVPRADARTGPGQYLNPLTGELGKKAGTHIPLE
jgi:hypothetical protein